MVGNRVNALLWRRMDGCEGINKRRLEHAIDDLKPGFTMGWSGYLNTTLSPAMSWVTRICPTIEDFPVSFSFDTQCDRNSVPDVSGYGGVDVLAERWTYYGIQLTGYFDVGGITNYSLRVR